MDERDEQLWGLVFTSFSTHWFGTETHLKEQLPSTEKCSGAFVSSGNECGSFVHNDVFINENEIVYL